MASNIESETRCHVCNRNYLDNSALKIHLQLEHGQSFDEENRNEIANQQEHNFCGCSRSECKKVHEKEKLFHCEECDKYFTLKASLTRHNNEVHEEKPFNCEKCDKFYTSERSLKAHDNSVHARKEAITVVIRYLRPEFKFPAKVEMAFFPILAIIC